MDGKWRERQLSWGTGASSYAGITMNPVALASYVSIGAGVLCVIAAIIIGLMKGGVARIVAFLAAGLLFIFGGGYGLEGLDRAAGVLRALGVVAKADPSSAEYKVSLAELAKLLQEGKLGDAAKDAFKSVVLANPPEEAKVAPASGEGTPEGRKDLEGIQLELKKRCDEAAASVAAKQKQGLDPRREAAVFTVPELRYVKTAPVEKIQELQIDQAAVREALRRRQ
jgi:hypothetical protein